eukprot:4751760-Pleurochrysis_carterae.AAC.7
MQSDIADRTIPRNYTKGIWTGVQLRRVSKHFKDGWYAVRKRKDACRRQMLTMEQTIAMTTETAGQRQDGHRHSHDNRAARPELALRCRLLFLGLFVLGWQNALTKLVKRA